MDLEKFLSMCLQRKLTFCRSDRLGDPHEATLPSVRGIEYVRAISERFPPIGGPDRQLIDEKIKEIFANRDHLLGLQRQSWFVNCWHASEHESSPMWSSYSKNSFSVCIKSKYSTLVEVLPENAFIGIVQYIDFSKEEIPLENLYNVIMTKRAEFRSENEVRAVITGPARIDLDEISPVTLDVGIDLEKLFDEVRMNPDSPSWFQELLEDLALRLSLKFKLEPSSLKVPD